MMVTWPGKEPMDETVSEQATPDMSVCRGTAMSATSADVDAAVAAAHRSEWAFVLAATVRITRDIDLAEECAQDAYAQALATWAEHGIPAKPGAWLTTVARRRALDLLRRRDTARRALPMLVTDAILGAEPAGHHEIPDDRLRLIFTCCHPGLAQQAQAALSLRLLCGLSTAEVARSLLVPEATMAKRLSRAKQKIAQAGIPYRVPAAGELPGRLAGVAATVYLIFNEGYAAGAGTDLVRATVADEAIRLARLLAGLMPDEPTVLGLLALLVLTDARRAARVDRDGRPVLLADQDRSAWDTEAIKEGVELVGRALRRTPDHPDQYVVQAAIAACHALAPSYAETNWDAVISWYDVLPGLADSPVARLNRAAAVAERDGPGAALALVDSIDGLPAYPWWHATRAELLQRLGRPAEARAAYERALALSMCDPQAGHLRDRMSQLPPP